MLSGAPIVVEEWAAATRKKKEIKVFISHGSKDQVLPFAASGWSRDLLAKHGAIVKYHAHDGGHDIGSTTLPKLIEFLSSL